MELNRYVYAAGNPVRWGDPSGHLFAETGGINITSAKNTRDFNTRLGALSGGLLGMTIGGIFAATTYHLAATGQCGTDRTAEILGTSREQFILNSIALGGVLGVASGAAIGYGGAPAIVAGGLTALEGLYAMAHATNNMFYGSDGVRFNVCDAIDLVLGAATVVAGTSAIARGLSTWNAQTSGSPSNPGGAYSSGGGRENQPVLYRGDTRSPMEIQQAGGFAVQNPAPPDVSSDVLVLGHAEGVTEYQQYSGSLVSTSISEEGVLRSPVGDNPDILDFYMYRIRNPGGGIDVLGTLERLGIRPGTLALTEGEIAFRTDISSLNVLEWQHYHFDINTGNWFATEWRLFGVTP
jgi:hypothetical protein